MRPTGNEGSTITITEAAALTAKYRAANPNTIIAHFVGKNTLKEILDQDGYMGLRIYYGINTDDTPEVVIVGVDANGDDMLDVIVDRTSPCPNMCSSANALNS